jgi:hypothetical protein
MTRTDKWERGTRGSRNAGRRKVENRSTMLMRFYVIATSVCRKEVYLRFKVLTAASMKIPY